MSQIINLHIGGAGAKVGLQFWKQLQKEYSLQSQKQEELPSSEKYYLPSKFYDENSKGKRIPRCIFADNDTRTDSYLHNHNTLKHSFEQYAIQTHEAPTSNIYGEAFYNSSSTLVQQLLSTQINKQLQKCDRFSGFIVTQSCSGGTGSGTGAALSAKLRDYYPACMFQMFTINPGKQEQYISGFNHSADNVQADKMHVDMSPLGTYNTVLNMHYLVENTDLVYNFENKAVVKTLLHERDDPRNIGFKEVNQYMGRCMVEHTAAYRYPGPLNTNQRKRATNLILFPRIKFLKCGLSRKKQKNYIYSALSDNQQMMHGINRNQPRIMTTSVHIRDPFSYQSQIDQKIKKKHHQLNNLFAEWIPTPIHSSITSEVNREWGPSAWVISNASLNISWIKNLNQNFTAQFRRKAFLHHYTSVGMDQMEFTQAESNLNDLLSEYVPCCGCGLDQEEFDEEEDY